MKITVKAKPGAKTERVERIENLFTKKDDICLRVSVKEPATDGRANRAILDAVAAHFKVAPSRVHILSGHTSRQKIIKIDE